MTRYTADFTPKKLLFKQPAGTSRGVYTERNLFLLTIRDEEKGIYGVGEIAPLPNLSCDDVPELEDVILDSCKHFNGVIDYDALRNYPSVLFGFESAWNLLCHGGSSSNTFFESPFSRGECGIDINGLIWMGTFEEMKSRIEEKLKAGFHCIKLKIGAINFDEELELLKKIRREYSADEITLRVDANGGFRPDEAMEKLNRLSELDIHSIKQPIRAGQWEAMARLCKDSPIPIALDEELIGINTPTGKQELLNTVRPAYIILKPTLHGSFYGCNEWIELAKERNIGYWATSALESNVGLTAIAQWASTLNVSIPQGLGTGALFQKNIDLFPIQIVGEKLWFNKCP